jgi:predicted RNA binding protein YcfA (HicA-like mRNA interferase family)
MTRKLPPVTSKEVIWIARILGFMLDRQKGSHAIYYRESDRSRIVVPIHAGSQIKPKTYAGIFDDMGLTVEEFRDIL